MRTQLFVQNETTRLNFDQLFEHLQSRAATSARKKLLIYYESSIEIYFY